MQLCTLYYSTIQQNRLQQMTIEKHNKKLSAPHLALYTLLAPVRKMKKLSDSASVLQANEQYVHASVHAMTKLGVQCRSLSLVHVCVILIF